MKMNRFMHSKSFNNQFHPLNVLTPVSIQKIINKKLEFILK